MKYLSILMTAAFLFLFVSPADSANLKSIRQPILICYESSPLLAVTFNHGTHKQVKCRTCHHMANEDGKRFIKCTNEDCHSIPGARERDPMSMFMAFHAKGMDRSCYGCHLMEAKSHPEFKGCRPCHMSPQSRKAMLEAQADRATAK